MFRPIICTFVAALPQSLYIILIPFSRWIIILEYSFPYLPFVPFVPFVLHKVRSPCPLLDRVLPFSGSRVPPLSSGAGDGRRCMGGNVYHLASFTPRSSPPPSRAVTFIIICPHHTYCVRIASWKQSQSISSSLGPFISGFICKSHRESAHLQAPLRPTNLTVSQFEIRVSCQESCPTITLTPTCRFPFSVQSPVGYVFCDGFVHVGGIMYFHISWGRS